ncbi:DoxX family protein [Paenibacillus thiaminolyticus]|uniref:DoxX family protein n=1 Tax=Paenibacillus thiaminolyticus TaxID=49283 RepID=UPI0035A6DFD0
MTKLHEIGALLLRIFLGVAFLIHGFQKFQGGIGNTMGFFESLGLPGFAAYAVALIEIIGGIALILGLGTRLFAALFIIIMAGAMVKVKFAAGFTGSPEMAGYELDLAYFVMAVYFVLSPGSTWSFDRLLFGSKPSA